MVSIQDEIMGVALRKLVDSEKVSLKDFNNKKIAIDGNNTLYQFLSIIRQRDGTPLKDSEGRVTSHLAGLLYRTANMVEMGIKPVYVFDGEPHPLKKQTLLKRREIKEEAKTEWEEALKIGDIERARMKAQQTSRLTSEMIQQSKDLLDALGIPFIQAPGEGESQASKMVIDGEVDMVASQDFDCLLFGAPLLLRNLAITGKRKLPRKKVWVEIKPERIFLSKMLQSNGISREQLVDIAILIGTDFNKGIKGIGPKTALKLIKDNGKIERLVEKEKIPEPSNYEEIREIFLHPKIIDEYEIKWKKADEKATKMLLCDEHQFSEKRVEKALEKFSSFAKSFGQQSLFEF